MIKFKHNGDKYRLRFLYNRHERGTQRVRYDKPDKHGNEYGYYPYRGVTVMEVNKSDDEYSRYIEVYCSVDDTFYDRTGAELCLRKWLRGFTGQKRQTPLHDAAWKAFREQFTGIEVILDRRCMIPPELSLPSLRRLAKLP